MILIFSSLLCVIETSFWTRHMFVLIIDTAKTNLDPILINPLIFTMYIYAHVLPPYRNCWRFVIEPSISSILTYAFEVEMVRTEWNDSLVTLLAIHEGTRVDTGSSSSSPVKHATTWYEHLPSPRNLSKYLIEKTSAHRNTWKLSLRNENVA